MKTLKSTLLFVILLQTSFAFAQDHTEDGDSHHDSVIHLGPIDVLGEMGKSDILHTVPTVSNLHGDKLFKKSKNSIGETLRNELGVNATQFGPAASRPVIRGLEGDRIRILQNGIGVLDASGTSQDHAVPINPLTAESVEVVRGPISLLYGSSAVGGVVNIVNSRVHKDYFPGFFGGVDVKSESVNAGQTYAAKMDYGTNNLMFHLDGHYNRALETQTPEGPITNSEMEQHGAAFGTTFFTKSKDYLGLSYSTFQNIYGVVSEADVDIALKQQRLDLGGYYKLNGFFKALRLKSAQTFYKHTEFEDGSVGTVFENSGTETRVEFIQDDRGGWHGVLGLQTQFLELSALGDEAFLPTTDQMAAALFVFEEIEWDSFKLNGGGRVELTQIDTAGTGFFATSQENEFTTGSAAVGGLYKLTPTASTTLNLSYNERAPTYQELYAGGPHLAVGIFEQGDVDLEKEKSLAVEWSIKRKTPLHFVSLTAFNQEFQNYIGLNPSGVLADTDDVPGPSAEDFEIYNYQRQKARINGVEFEVSHVIHGFYSFRFTGDYLYGQNTETNQPLPRISPIRLGLELGYDDYEHFAASAIWRNIFKQTRTAPSETSTPSYNTVDLNLEYKSKLGLESLLKLYLQVNNIGNVKARNHVSVLKNNLLLPGRNLVVGARYLF